MSGTENTASAHGFDTAFVRPEGVKVVVRLMKFPFETKKFDRYWFNGHPMKSMLWTQLSTSFAPGEKFFMDSARAMKHHVKQPELLEEMVEFCKQEGHHTFQHQKFDKINAAMGIDVAGCERRYRAVLNHSRRRLSPMNQLAVTVALEHFTASLAERLLAEPHITEGADPNVLALWYWHAVEECEHKATCFEVYEAAGGGYFRRIMMLHQAWALIMVLSLYNTFSLLRKEKKLFSRSTLSGLWYLFGYKGMFTGLIGSYLTYLSPKFHPWKHDNSGHIKRWLADNLHLRDASRLPKAAVSA